MKPLVADASALLRLVLPEPGRDEVRGVLLKRGLAGAPILVPSTLWIEVVNVMARRYRFSGAVMIEAVHELDQLGLETRDMGREWVLPVIDATERHQLTAHDAAYLVLAEATDADLLTADRELARAAGKRAIWVGPDGRKAEPPAPYEMEPTWPTWRGAATYLGELRRQAAGMEISDPA